MSIQIIDKTKPPAPLYVREPTPTFTTTYESDKYWDEQRRRWIEGYSGLTGLHYFYLQEWHLKLIAKELQYRHENNISIKDPEA